MDTQPQTIRKCPYCNEDIQSDAIKCKHCHSIIEPETPTHGGICPYCKEKIHPDASKCKHCFSSLLPAAPGPLKLWGIGTSPGPIELEVQQPPHPGCGEVYVPQPEAPSPPDLCCH